MTFKQSVKSVFSNYATFKGRARRSEYWYFFVFTLLVDTVLYVLGESTQLGLFSTVSSLFALAVLVPNLAVTWRRLHDIGKSGANFFFCLIPLVGWILLLVWLCKDSQPGENQYGPNPKE
ncbi:MAG: DUF805 domain-containing protein [Oscillospiraceae bacterium]|nr:DUF805 domain-containing protein [Oscillospiraceae bacterium]